ncbi:hypothetical protein Tco_1548356, partial [Tanacetum coccineum]
MDDLEFHPILLVDLSSLPSGDFLTREPAHSRISIASEPVAMSRDSRINADCINASTYAHSDTTNAHTHLPLIPSLEIDQNSKQKELCPDGSDQFPVNKGDVRFAADIIPAPSAKVPNPEHDHVVHEHSTLSVVTSTDVGCSSQRRLGDSNSDFCRNKSNSSWYHQMRSRTHVQQPQVHRRQRLPANQESPTISN